MAVKQSNLRQIDIFGSYVIPRVTPPKPSQSIYTAVKEKIVYTGVKLYLKPNRLIVLPQFAGGTMVRSVSQRATEANLLQNKSNGKVSKKAQSKISNAINWLALAAKKKRVYHKATNKTYQFKLNLITLTLPDTTERVTESFFKEQLLQPFLSYARKYYQLKNYVWKIELQGNGKVHVHITGDVFIYHTDLRRVWNMQLNRHGLLNDFEMKFGHKAPPTEQVKCVRSVKDMAAYMAKYMAMDGDFNTGDVGRLWGCNYELSRASEFTLSAERYKEIDLLGSLLSSSVKLKQINGIMQSNGFHKRIGDIYFPTAIDWRDNITGPLKTKFTEIIHYLRTHLPMPEDVPIGECPLWCLS